MHPAPDSKQKHFSQTRGRIQVAAGFCDLNTGIKVCGKAKVVSDAKTLNECAHTALAAQFVLLFR